jgi:hypothetical protein
LQPAARNVERLFDGHASVLPFRIGFGRLGEFAGVQVLCRRVRARFMRHGNLVSGNGEVNPDMIAIACLVMSLEQLEQNVTAHDPRVVGLELPQAHLDFGFERRGALYAAKRNGWRESHINIPPSELQRRHHLTNAGFRRRLPSDRSRGGEQGRDLSVRASDFRQLFATCRDASQPESAGTP